jgi:hypothetical protein
MVFEYVFQDNALTALHVLVKLFKKQFFDYYQAG